MLKDYVLGTEIANKGNFHIANISMVLKDFGLVEGIDFLKFGGITLLNKNSLVCPKYINNLMWDKSMTDLSDLLPLTYFKDILENSLNNIKKDYSIVKVVGKQFVKVKDGQLKDILMDEKLVKYVVDNHEINELVNENYILGHIKLSGKKSLTWY